MVYLCACNFNVRSTNPVGLLGSFLFGRDVVWVQLVNMDRINFPIAAFSRVTLVPRQFFEGFV